MSKYLLKNLVLLAVMLLALASCDNDDDSNEEANIYADLVGQKISGNVVWSTNQTITGKVYILPSASLTINAGVTVSFTYHNDNVDNVGAVVTLAGDGDKASGQLIANGTATSPIVFTSAQTNKQPGDWGGIILIGEGETNIGGQGSVEGLADVIKYGGSNNSDNSGTLKYVRIEYCGYGIAPDSEINGLSFYGVGSGTTIDYVQVHKCTDDGFEWFGGAVSATHLVSSYNDDDSFDMDEGWSGNGQFWLAVQTTGADNGFESDGRKTLGSGTATNPTIFNVTLVGLGSGKDANDKNYGMRLREDFAGNLGNFYVSNFAGVNWKLESMKGEAVDATSANFDNGVLKMTGMSFYNNSQDNTYMYSGFNSATDSTRFQATAHNNVEEMGTFTNAGSNDYRVSGLSSAVATPAGLTTANYRGAFGTVNWAAGWTNWQ